MAGAGACYWAAGDLAAPVPRDVGAPPSDLPGHRVRVPSPAAGTLEGWLVPGRPDMVDRALVLEAVYPTLEEAIDNQLAIRFGALGPPLAPLLTLQLRPRLGFSADDLRPIDAIAHVGAPLLVIAGTADRHTTLAQARRLFARAQPPKELWEVSGASHVDFHRAARAEYEARVGAFFASALRREPMSPPPGGVPVAPPPR